MHSCRWCKPGNLDDSIYMEFVNTLSLNAIDEIALCDFNEVEFKSFKYKSFNKSSENSFKDGVKNYTNAEILKCKYNPGYNYGTFRIAIEKFLYEIDLLNIHYEFTYLQEDANDTHFIWINSFYNSDYSTILLNEWINNTNFASTSAGRDVFDQVSRSESLSSAEPQISSHTKSGFGSASNIGSKVKYHQ